MEKRHFFGLLVRLAILCGIIFYLPGPASVDPRGWKAFLIFILTLTLVIRKVYDMGTVSFLALSLVLVTQILPIEKALIKFSYPVSWLVLFAFFIAKGFILSGLGTRIALFLSSYVGSTPLRLAYALSAAEFLVAPFIPSNTARGGGLIVPIAVSLGHSVFLGDAETSKTPSSGTAYLLYCCFQANLMSSALFLTAMAGNPIIANYALEAGFELSWLVWFQGAWIPALISFIITPWFLHFYFQIDSQIHSVGDKAQLAYKALGPMKDREKIMGVIFGFLLVCWIGGGSFGIDPTSAALFAVVLLLLSRMVTWSDLVLDQQAWTTFVWLTALFTLTSLMKEYGFIDWVTGSLSQFLPAMSQISLFLVLCIFNFYSHYFFASLTSHITTIVHPLLVLGLKMGLPIAPLVLGLAYTTALSGGLTHYGTGSGTITYGYGYWSISQWWTVGFFQGSLILAIFLASGVLIWF